MKSVRLDYPLGLLCRVFDVSRSGFYAALDRPPSRRAQDDERLKVAIKAAHLQTRETYGPLRLQPELVAQGFDTGRDRIVRLRRELGLRCKQKRKFKATTNSNHALPVAPNLLGAPTEFGKNSTLRISASPKRTEFSLFNVPALRPNIVPGQVDVFPAQRRQVSQHAVVG